MRRIWTNHWVLVLITVVLGGCATSKENVLSRDSDTTMLDIWNQETTGASSNPASRALLDARQQLRRPVIETDFVTHPEMQVRYTRTAANEIYRQFHRLPNPDLVMYVFPHLAGTDPVPIPGYTTVFPLYQRIQYALPGERTVDY